MGANKLYSFLRAVVRPIFSLLYPVKLDGLENVPAEGGCLICANHISAIDPIILALHVRHRYLHYMGKAEIFKGKFMDWFCRALYAFPVDRGHSDLNAIRTALKLLADGHILGLFPQGTRSPDNRHTPMLNGVSMIALRAQKPVIPVYIGGPYKLFHRTPVRIGKPVDLSGFGRRMDADTLTAATHRIEDAVWAMEGK